MSSLCSSVYLFMVVFQIIFKQFKTIPNSKIETSKNQIKIPRFSVFRLAETTGVKRMEFF